MEGDDADLVSLPYPSHGIDLVGALACPVPLKARSGPATGAIEPMNAQQVASAAHYHRARRATHVPSDWRCC